MSTPFDSPAAGMPYYLRTRDTALEILHLKLLNFAYRLQVESDRLIREYEAARETPHD